MEHPQTDSDPLGAQDGWDTTDATDRFEELVDGIAEFMRDEYRQDPEFRLAVLTDQLGDVARHTSHDPERNPPTRPLEEDPETAWGDALWQLLCVGWAQGIDVGEAIGRALARMENTEGYLQQSDTVGQGLVASTGSQDQVTGIVGQTVLAVREWDPDDTIGLGHWRCVVTEIGGISSHAATVARENDVPAVVGVQGLMDEISLGDQIRVDLDTGEISAIGF